MFWRRLRITAVEEEGLEAPSCDVLTPLSVNKPDLFGPLAFIHDQQFLVAPAPAHPRHPRHIPHSGEFLFVLLQLLPVDYVRESWWLSDISPWFAGAMLFQVRPQTSIVPNVTIAPPPLLRLEREAWSMIKLLRKATNE